MCPPADQVLALRRTPARRPDPFGTYAHRGEYRVSQPESSLLRPLPSGDGVGEREARGASGGAVWTPSPWFVRVQRSEGEPIGDMCSCTIFHAPSSLTSTIVVCWSAEIGLPPSTAL